VESQRGEGREKREEGKGEREREERRFLFWNVAGLGRKDEEFWEYISNYDFVGLVETWVDEERWEKIKGWLPSSHEWKYSAARKEKRKGRAKGGMMIGTRKGWGEGGE